MMQYQKVTAAMLKHTIQGGFVQSTSVFYDSRDNDHIVPHNCKYCKSYLLSIMNLKLHLYCNYI